MLRANTVYHPLIFKTPAGTSRGVLHRKESWFLKIENSNEPGLFGLGECSLIQGLSPDDRNSYEDELLALCNQIDQHQKWNANRGSLFPSIRFGLETALLDLDTGGNRMFNQNSFTTGQEGIPINGLVWMGEKSFMRKQVKEKIQAGFGCIKIKVGAIDFDEELNLIRSIRSEFAATDIEIRLDANGAFKPEDAMEKLKYLTDFSIHSIEQPIRQGLSEQMANLCKTSPIPIALDEELIMIRSEKEKRALLKQIRPQYIILKPSLLGGTAAADSWIRIANEFNIGWWATSALESNIGLNAIAQWVFTKNNPMPQGLGTGQLYVNNIVSPLLINKGKLFHSKNVGWNLSLLTP